MALPLEPLLSGGDQADTPDSISGAAMRHCSSPSRSSTCKARLPVATTSRRESGDQEHCQMPTLGSESAGRAQSGSVPPTR